MIEDKPVRSDYTEYDLKQGISRIDQIIKGPDIEFEERDSIPAREMLSFANGFRVKCAAICVDVREPAQIADFSEITAHAKLYRSYISEVTAIMNGNPKCAEINVDGTSVLGFFDAPWQDDIDDVFSTVGKISTIVRIINTISTTNQIRVGIGLAFGKAFLVKLSYRGNKSEQVIWKGDVANEASKLASYGNKEATDKETMVSETVYYNLSDENKKLLLFNPSRDCYHGSIVNSHMNNWYKQHCH